MCIQILVNTYARGLFLIIFTCTVSSLSSHFRAQVWEVDCFHGGLCSFFVRVSFFLLLCYVIVCCPSYKRTNMACEEKREGKTSNDDKAFNAHSISIFSTFLPFISTLFGSLSLFFSLQRCPSQIRYHEREWRLKCWDLSKDSFSQLSLPLFANFDLIFWRTSVGCLISPEHDLDISYVVSNCHFEKM